MLRKEWTFQTFKLPTTSRKIAPKCCKSHVGLESLLNLWTFAKYWQNIPCTKAFEIIQLKFNRFNYSTSNSTIVCIIFNADQILSWGFFSDSLSLSTTYSKQVFQGIFIKYLILIIKLPCILFSFFSFRSTVLKIFDRQT